MTSAREFLERASTAGGLHTDDVLTAMLPLFRQLASWHADELVAPSLTLRDLEVNDRGGLFTIATHGVRPTRSIDAVERIQRPFTSALNVVGQSRVTSDQMTHVDDLQVGDATAALEHPKYVPGYQCWEHLVGHHDTLTDIFCLGQLLASFALDLDFTDLADVQRFAANRTNLFALRPQLHPMLAATIVTMTELNRHKRATELTSIVQQLENYREQSPDLAIAQLPGFANAKLADRRSLVKTHLRDRLFELSRRNRLLYFKPSQANVNLTVASVPLVINVHSVKLEKLFLWHRELAREVSECKPLVLSRWLEFNDQPYLPAALDRLIAEARRHRAEYGFAQLRLVIAFLAWHNLKEAPTERIVSPLLLLPVELTRKKGVRDQYLLEPTTNEAEVNPVLRHHLRQLYGLELPETVTLSETALTELHAELQRKIHVTEPSVTLRLADQPDIELIHERAKQRLSQFNRRKAALATPRKRSNASFDYSYAAEDYRPLGLKLFHEKVAPTPLPQRSAAGGTVAPRYPQMVPTPESASEPTAAANVTERQTFALRGERAGNPYLWDLDLCAVTLGNFNYRKMSLVRDYGTLIEESLVSDAFDRVFSVDPKPIDNDEPPALERSEDWSVVKGDATQRAAVALARTGRSYIVQGPPGTGKSQTITNLIADYVARGKRVLFVCEKRAAIDVVFHRLRQQGLDELCCLIHDSQTDKKAFVQNLKQTYEGWLAEPDDTLAANATRTAHLKRAQQDLEQLRRFDAAMVSTPAHVGGSVHALLQRLVELRAHDIELRPRDVEALPDFAVWRRHAELATRLSQTLTEVCGTSVFARHVFRWLNPQLAAADRPLQHLYDLADGIERALDALDQGLANTDLAPEHWDTLAEVERLIAFAKRAAALAARGQLALLDTASTLSADLATAARTMSDADTALAAAREKTLHWREKLPVADTTAALAQARATESSFLKLFKPSWWRLKSIVTAHYDFSKHTVAPSVTQVLETLHTEYECAQALQRERRTGIARFLEDPAQLQPRAVALREQDQGVASVDALRALLLDPARGRQLADRLNALAAPLAELMQMLPALLLEYREQSLATLGEIVRDLRDDADSLPDLLPLLSELGDTPPSFAGALRHFALSMPELESAVGRASLEALYRSERWLPRFDGRTFERATTRIAATETELLASNAIVLRSAKRAAFREHVQLSQTSATQLDEASKAFKKKYSTGRRELEHEFGKTMRYRSIRDLAAGDSGHVVRDLKPIWLMSPLSVSDTLPLETSLFDVVIFDEASQIPIEEAVPALYRAPQVIVVGDEMQLPPTNFFSAARDPDEAEVMSEEDGERLAIALDADSLLTQSARNLPATLLAWHYRSRSESLIGFSNAAFYAGNLFTIPDRDLPASEQRALAVKDPADARNHVDALLGRPLSFHWLERSPYDNRRNSGEAVYVAQVVRELLRRNTGLSIGVVAFSEAQQGEIESALGALAGEDAEFAARLEEEYVREQDDQFCGLFVKNLENVQGDERDIIVLSICYGPDANGRMVMNFGPINQRGGEKRLNVIFSRARHHMAVVSSIHHSAITNDYNDGAAALKNFLQYAESASLGDLRTARTILEGLNALTRRTARADSGEDVVATQIAQVLRERGYVIDTRVGQSRFRCDLAVRAPEQRHYCVGILVDTAEHYANRDVAERCVTRPEIMRAFGWRVVSVLTRDWYHERDAVLDRLERAIRGESVSLEVAPVDDEPVAVEEPYVATVPDIAAAIAAANATTELPAPAPAQPGNVRRFEMIEGSSSKFWEISQDNLVVVVRYGRIGTQGQTLQKNFDTLPRATREVEKLTAEKLKKGYKEIES
jgi:predicted DNA-binding WGR domain protein